MTATPIPFATAEEQEAAAAAVAGHLRNEGLIAYPTETVYGFGCGLYDGALDRLVALKRRVLDKAFLLLLLDPALAGVDWTESARLLARAFWPGPLTLSMRALPGAFPPRVLSASGTVAVRVSSHEGVRRILAEYGAPLTSTSANLPGERPALSAAEARTVLRDVAGAGEVLVLDGGTLPLSPPSTIVDCSAEPPRVVRAGAVTATELAEIIHAIESG